MGKVLGLSSSRKRRKKREERREKREERREKREERREKREEEKREERRETREERRETRDERRETRDERREKRDERREREKRDERRETRDERRETRDERRETRDERRETRDERREARGERRETRDERRDDDDELVINPPTPCQIGKHPPAPKRIRPASKGRTVEGIEKREEREDESSQKPVARWPVGAVLFGDLGIWGSGRAEGPRAFWRFLAFSTRAAPAAGLRAHTHRRFFVVVAYYALALHRALRRMAGLVFLLVFWGCWRALAKGTAWAGFYREIPRGGSKNKKNEGKRKKDVQISPNAR